MRPHQRIPGTVLVFCAFLNCLPPRSNRANTPSSATAALLASSYPVHLRSHEPRPQNRHLAGNFPDIYNAGAPQSNVTSIWISISMIGLPLRPSLEKKHAITMVRLSFQASAPIDRLNVDRDPLASEWKSTISLIEKQEGWRYVNLGNEPGDPTVALIIIGWLDSTAPAPLFNPGRKFEDGPILPHLEPHLSQPPEVLTLWHARDRARRVYVTTQVISYRRAPAPDLPKRIAEFVRLRGPAQVLESAIKDISQVVDAFNIARTPSEAGNVAHNWIFSGCTTFAVEDHEDHQEQSTSHTASDQTDKASYAFIFYWTDKDYRHEFKDPSILDRGASPYLSEDANREFWWNNVEVPMNLLRDQHGVQITSWDYEAYNPVAYNDAQASADNGYRY